MNPFTWGTFLSCMFLSFMLGFLACHVIYAGLDRKIHDNDDFVRRNNSSLSRQ